MDLFPSLPLDPHPSGSFSTRLYTPSASASSVSVLNDSQFQSPPHSLNRPSRSILSSPSPPSLNHAASTPSSFSATGSATRAPLAPVAPHYPARTLRFLTPNPANATNPYLKSSEKSHTTHLPSQRNLGSSGKTPSKRKSPISSLMPRPFPSVHHIGAGVSFPPHFNPSTVHSASLTSASPSPSPSSSLLESSGIFFSPKSSDKTTKSAQESESQSQSISQSMSQSMSQSVADKGKSRHSMEVTPSSGLFQSPASQSKDKENLTLFGTGASKRLSSGINTSSVSNRGQSTWSVGKGNRTGSAMKFQTTMR